VPPPDQTRPPPHTRDWNVANAIAGGEGSRMIKTLVRFARPHFRPLPRHSVEDAFTSSTARARRRSTRSGCHARRVDQRRTNVRKRTRQPARSGGARRGERHDDRSSPKPRRARSPGACSARYAAAGSRGDYQLHVPEPQLLALNVSCVGGFLQYRLGWKLFLACDVSVIRARSPSSRSNSTSPCPGPWDPRRARDRAVGNQRGIGAIYG
jgi:hypothetical protein